MKSLKCKTGLSLILISFLSRQQLLQSNIIRNICSSTNQFITQEFRLWLEMHAYIKSEFNWNCTVLQSAEYPMRWCPLRRVYLQISVTLSEFDRLKRLARKWKMNGKQKRINAIFVLILCKLKKKTMTNSLFCGAILYIYVGLRDRCNGHSINILITSYILWFNNSIDCMADSLASTQKKNNDIFILLLLLLNMYAWKSTDSFFL